MTPGPAPVPRERLRFLAGRIHRLGPRPLFELLNELAAGADVVERLERYAALPADFIREHGGSELPIVRALEERR